MSENTLQCGENLQYLYNGNGNLSVVSIDPDAYDSLGDMWDNVQPSEKWDSIETIYIQPGVEHIGAAAFQDTTAYEISIPDSVKSIGAEAFKGAENLEETIIPDSVKIIGREAFANSGLNQITIPKSVDVIEYGAFKDNDKLTEAHIDAKVIQESAFLNSNLESVSFGSNVKQVGDLAFGDNKLSGAIIIPNMELSGRHVFYGNDKNLEIVTNAHMVSVLKNDGVDAREPNLIERAMIAKQELTEERSSTSFSVPERHVGDDLMF